MFKASTLIVLLSTPPTATLPNCGSVLNVQGNTIHCCSLNSGQQCCSGSLGEDGKPNGCGC